MMNVLSSHPQNLPHRVHESCLHARPSKIQCLGNSCFEFHHAATLSAKGQPALVDSYRRPPPFSRLIAVRAVGDNEESSSGKDDDQEKQSKKEEGSFGLSREDLERMLGPDDAKFNGLDLANLIRKKYGRSYDVQLIKKEFMGRNLLAMNVMWKYREQRSFPLSEEEYLLRLDDVANTLKCWGAVSHVRNTLEKLKERPRIGKAVSIFIDMDESGGRSNEWIYK